MPYRESNDNKYNGNNTKDKGDKEHLVYLFDSEYLIFVLEIHFTLLQKLR